VAVGGVDAFEEDISEKPVVAKRDLGEVGKATNALKEIDANNKVAVANGVLDATNGERHVVLVIAGNHEETSIVTGKLVRVGDLAVEVLDLLGVGA
jgi:hypothetical protein